MQKLQVIGNVTKDAEVKELSGRKVINFNVAVNESWKNKDGVKETKTTFYSCAIWRDADRSTELAKYLLKGIKVFVEGVPSAVIYSNNENRNVVDNRILVKELILLSTKEKTAETDASEKQGAFTSIENEGHDLPY